MKHTRILNRADKHFPTAPLIVDGLLLNEIVALLAEILVLDFQEHTQITVNSPPPTHRRILLTDAQQRIKDATPIEPMPTCRRLHVDRCP